MTADNQSYVNLPTAAYEAAAKASLSPQDLAELDDGYFTLSDIRIDTDLVIHAFLSALGAEVRNHPQAISTNAPGKYLVARLSGEVDDG